MLRNKSKKKKEKQVYRLPTEEEMLSYKPKRADFEWSTNDEGLVEIIVPKFFSNFGKSFCNVIRKEKTFIANMDKIGSLVWKNSDGKTTVKKILEKLRSEFPDEKDDLDQRLYLFIQQMGHLGYIIY